MKSQAESSGILAFSLFYVIVGGAEFLILFLSGFRLVSLGLLGFLSLATAYGLIKMRRWAVWLVVALFFLGITFGGTTLYTSIVMHTFNPSIDVLGFHLMLIAYLIANVIATVYVLTKKGQFQ